MTQLAYEHPSVGGTDSALDASVGDTSSSEEDEEVEGVLLLPSPLMPLPRVSSSCVVASSEETLLEDEEEDEVDGDEVLLLPLPILLVLVLTVELSLLCSHR